MSPRRMTSALFSVALAFIASGCEDGNLEDRIVDIEATGAVTGLVFLDSNGSGDADGADDPVEGLDVAILVQGTGQVIATGTTGSDGVFVITNVPVGNISVEVDSTFLGDSLSVVDFSGEDMSLAAGETLSLTLGITFPTFTLAEVRTLPAGLRVFTEGVVLNPRDRFSDGAVHLRAGDTFLRTTDNPAATTLFPGDSVRMLGRTGQDQGRPALLEAEAFILLQQAIIPIPLETTTALAETADAGALDAALVRIRDADIVDTMTVVGPSGRDLILTADDGSGPVEILLLEILGFNLNRVQPDSFSISAATGLLVPLREPSGAVRWQLVPRAAGEFIVDDIPFPGQVFDLTVVATTSTTATLNWTEVNDGFDNASDYNVRFRALNTLAWTDVSAGTCTPPFAGSAISDVASCIVDGLASGTTYLFQVQPFRGTLGVDAQFGPDSNIGAGATLP